MKLRPLFSNVIVKVSEREETTESGVIIPDTVSADRPQHGVVESVGPGKEKPVCVSAGDEIVFKKYSPDEVKIGEEKFLLLAEEDILAVVEE